MNIELKITDTTDVAFPIVIKDNRGNEIYKQFKDGSWWERTYDDNRNQLTYKNSDGYWTEKTYDNNGNKLTYKDSDGDWTEYTYDDNGNKLTYKYSDGYYEIKGKKVTKDEYDSFLNKGLIIEPKELKDNDKLIKILKETIEDYRRLVVKYKESEEIRDKLIENQKKQIANQLEIINLLKDGLK